MRWSPVNVASITRDEDRLGQACLWLSLSAVALGLWFATRAFADTSYVSGPQQLEHVEAELIAQTTAVRPGETFTAGLRLKMDEHWHTYWINPGDSGMTTALSWDAPDGVEVGPILWPAPQYFVVGGLASFAYEGQIVLPVRVSVPEGFGEDELTLNATADWLVCDDICLPGSADLSLTLPVVDNEPDVDTHWAELFAQAAQRTPIRLDDEAARAYYLVDQIVLEVKPAAGDTDDATPRTYGKDVRFFAYEGSGLALTAPQVVTVDAQTGWTRITLTVSPTHREPIDRLRGVVVFNDTQSAGEPSAFEVELPVTVSQTP